MSQGVSPAISSAPVAHLPTPVTEPLAQLKDIIAPSVSSWWPLAWGWWVLIVCIVVVVIAVIARWVVVHQRNGIKNEALAQLVLINKQPLTSAQRILAYDQLLRRVLLSYFPRQYVASLTGDRWFQFLDSFLTDLNHGFVSLQDHWMQALYQKEQTDIIASQVYQQQTQRCYEQTTLWLQQALPLSKQLIATMQMKLK